MLLEVSAAYENGVQLFFRFADIFAHKPGEVAFTEITAESVRHHLSRHGFARAGRSCKQHIPSLAHFLRQIADPRDLIRTILAR